MVHMYTNKCLEKARPLVESGDIDSLRYASLQLRMGIEYLFYELIPQYKDELPDDITSTKWQPQAIIDAILECDPSADQNTIIGISDNAHFNASNTTIAFNESRPNKKLLRNHYHRLGFYLHAPVNLLDHDLIKWKSDLEKAINTVAEYAKGRVLSNFGTFITVTCICGRVIKRNQRALDNLKEVRCLDPNCKAIYDVTLCENDQFQFDIRETFYICPQCNTQNPVSIGGLRDGKVISCTSCNKKVVAKASFSLALLDEVNSTEH